MTVTPVSRVYYSSKPASLHGARTSRKHWTRVGARACVCRRRETGNIILRCTCQRSRNSGCCTTVSWLRIDACVNLWLTCSKYYLFSAPTHTDLLNTSFLAENSPSGILNGFKPAWPQKKNWECESREKNLSFVPEIQIDTTELKKLKELKFAIWCFCFILILVKTHQK